MNLIRALFKSPPYLIYIPRFNESLPTDLFLALLGVALNQILFPFYGFEVGGFMRPSTVHKQTDFSENTTKT